MSWAKYLWKNKIETISLVGLFLVGLYVSPVAIFKQATDVRVEPEYVSGVLTASGILFGIWIIMLDRKSENKHVKAVKEVAGRFFFDGLFYFLASVFFLTLTAIGWFSSVIDFLYTVFSFFFNASILIIMLRALFAVEKIVDE